MKLVGWLFFALTVFASMSYAGDERLWKSKCGSCHGIDGKAQTKQGLKMGMADMTSPKWQTEFTDAKIKETLDKGVSRERNGKQQDMDSFRDDLTPEQISALIRYVRTLAK